jgi:hypothetical protein
MSMTMKPDAVHLDYLNLDLDPEEIERLDLRAT